MTSPRTVQRARGLRPGDHVCWGYDDRAAFLAVVADFLEEGLRRDERVAYRGPFSRARLVEDLSALPQRDELLSAGRLVVQPLDSAWVGDDSAGSGPRVEALAEEVSAARAEGFSGLRIATDVTGLAIVPALVPLLLAYELSADDVIASSGATVLCGYDEHEVGEALDALAAVHPMQHRDTGVTTFSARLADGALALSGEVDLVNERELAAVLDAAGRGSAGGLDVDLSELEFLDVVAARTLSRFVATMSQRGRPVEVHGGTSGAQRCLSLFGLGDQSLP